MHTRFPKIFAAVLLLTLPRVAVRAEEAPSATPLPGMLVEGESQPLKESEPSGPFGAPEWTTARRFTTTRVYLQQGPWEFGFEQWWRGRFFKDDTAGHLFQEELEVGLPWRFQFDLYENWIMDDDGRSRHHDVATELRWALADWGKIPLNPTFYGEWKFVDEDLGGDVFEVKLLLGEEIAPRWHWGLNLVWEQEVAQERATELAWSQGVSYTVIDQCLGLGLEMKFTHETIEDERGDPEIVFNVGPSIQWRPFRSAHLDVVPLFGVTGDSPRVEAYVIFGIDFGRLHGKEQYSPASLRGN